MKSLILPLDTKSLYFNVKNDNTTGHTPTVATPIKKMVGDNKLSDIFLLKNKEVDISTKNQLVDLLIKHSKTSVIIRKVYSFNRLSVNGRLMATNRSFGIYIKEEVDETKVQFGRLKIHYPSKFVYEDDEININNKEIYREISRCLHDYAFMITSFEYVFETDTLNFNAVIIGENNIPYSKVFIKEKGAGNKFNVIFNENADDYDREIISLKKKFGDEVDPHNYLEYFRKMKGIAATLVGQYLRKDIVVMYEQYPYSIYDFVFLENGIKKYGLLRVTATKNCYFNLSFIQQLFMMNFSDDVRIFLVTDIFDTPKLNIYKYEDLTRLSKVVNSMKYEEDF